MGRSMKLVAALAAVVLVGCGSDSNSSPMDSDNIRAGRTDNDSPQYVGTYTLQGAVMNAVTGQRIAGNDLQLWLIQGEEIRTPNRLERDVAKPLAGEYAFTGIPADYFRGNKVYKVVAIAPGFQRFEGEVSFQVNYVDGEDIVDTVYNRIGNIYLFPIGVAAPDYAFTVTYNGKGVPNATVLLSQCSWGFEGPRAAAPRFEDRTIWASPGYVPSLSATTDAAGRVTFAGAQLALGACYEPFVLPVSFEGVQLAAEGSDSIIAGLDVHEIVIPLGDLEPGNALGLWVTSASNSVAGSVQADGKLVLRFSRPVSLVNPTGFAATASTGTLNAAPVLASLSADGLELTLTPSWATPPAATARNVTVTYGDGTAGVTVQGYPGAMFQVGNLVDASNASINPMVVLVGP